MSQHRFKVGQIVNFNPGKRAMPTSATSYKIVHRLPREGSATFTYRIKSTTEAFERVASENDITDEN
jgi:hypothetical protein